MSHSGQQNQATSLTVYAGYEAQALSVPCAEQPEEPLLCPGCTSFLIICSASQEAASFCALRAGALSPALSLSFLFSLLKTLFASPFLRSSTASPRKASRWLCWPGSWATRSTTGTSRRGSCAAASWRRCRRSTRVTSSSWPGTARWVLLGPAGSDGAGGLSVRALASARSWFSAPAAAEAASRCWACLATSASFPNTRQGRPHGDTGTGGSFPALCSKHTNPMQQACRSSVAGPST